MSMNHAVIWIDHHEAHVIFFNTEASKTEIIKTESQEPHLHHKRGTTGSGHVGLDTPYLHKVLSAVATTKEVLIVGPGSAKMELIKHANQHDPAIAKQIVGVETVDHPSDGQLLAFAKKYFLAKDRMIG